MEFDFEPVSFSWLEQLLGLSNFQSSSSQIGSPEKEKEVWPNSNVWLVKRRSLTPEADKSLTNCNNNRSKSNHHYQRKRSMGNYENFLEVNCFSQKQTRSREEVSGKGQVQNNPGSLPKTQFDDIEEQAHNVDNGHHISTSSEPLLDIVYGKEGIAGVKTPVKTTKQRRGTKKGVSTKCHRMRTRNSKDPNQVSVQEARIDEEVGVSMRWNLGKEMAKVIEKGVALGVNFKPRDAEMSKGEMVNVAKLKFVKGIIKRGVSSKKALPTISD
ncbi:hypothetical protein LWI29_026825 [Acer saccharum]|uniref:Uncharacterized protein n=1 Tax=Acer saccharum TaxID=4024 RepID=A0AA39SJR6_ACESA|nr:hypothetical protein LWI29_026825 [Acer saccharum]